MGMMPVTQMMGAGCARLCGAVLLAAFLSSIPGGALSAKVRSESVPPREARLAAARPVEELLRRALQECDCTWSEDAIQSAATAIAEVARQYDFSPALVLSLIHHESHFRVDAVSRRGAVGLTQILPKTAHGVARDLGYELPGQQALFDPATNIRLGLCYLASLRREYGSLDAAIAAYLAGPDAVRGGDSAAAEYLVRIRRTERTISGWMKTP
jgi:soluble lytic murein transglycosylase-like protein